MEALDGALGAGGSAVVEAPAGPGVDWSAVKANDAGSGLAFAGGLPEGV